MIIRPYQGLMIIRLHRGIQLTDIYKLAHQSIFGPEHLGEAAFEEAIVEEMHSPVVKVEEPLLEPIRQFEGSGHQELPAREADTIQRSHGE